MQEFELIARYFAPLASDVACSFGLIDDAAALPGRPGHDLVLTADAIAEGVHFLPDDPPDLVARKLLRVNLSDLAAKGAEPCHYLLTAAFSPQADETYVAEFVRGLAHDQEIFGITLLGGDTVASPGAAHFSLTALGYVPAGQMTRRSGARSGDLLYVTGSIGDGFLGLLAVREELPGVGEADLRFLANRYRLPQPRCATGVAVRAMVSAALDISDGLVADAGHLADASGAACVIELERVPLSAAAYAVLGQGLVIPERLLCGGDDYELLFAVPPDRAARLEQQAGRSGVSVTRIGQVEAGAGVRVVDGAGREVPITRGGYAHFT